MSSLGSPSTFFLAKKKAYEVERSLRFNRDDTVYLERTPSSDGNKRTWTFSAWIKRGQLTSLQTFFSAGTNNPDVIVKFTPSDQFEVSRYGGSYQTQVTSTQKFRDPSAWYHLVAAVDTTQATASNRVKMYVNGTQITDFAISSYPSQDYEYPEINDTGFSNKIGKHGSNSQNFDGYMTEINFIDGSQLTPSSFAETDAVTGEYKPKKFVGSYGTNGFYLNFSDNSGTTATTLGKDYSGNGNNFTPYNFSVAAGKEDDSSFDSPTNNFPTLSPVDRSLVGTMSNGNLRVSYNYKPASKSWRSTMALPSSGKIYWEWENEEASSNPGRWQTGLVRYTDEAGVVDFQGYNDVNYVSISFGGSTWNGTTHMSSWPSISFYSGERAAIAIDCSNGKLWVGKVASNGSTTWYANDGGTDGDPAGGTNESFTIPNFTTATEWMPHIVWHDGGGASSTTFTSNINFGNHSFLGTVPTGFGKLCSANLSDPSIKKPNQHFNTLLYTGNDSSDRDITGVGFQPDFLWIKNRSQTDWHMLQDAVRGANKVLYSNTTDGEDTDNSNGHVNSFLTDGFNVDAGASGNVNENNENYVAWNWKAGGSASSNSDGSITSSVSANTTAGFSIVTYTGNNASATVGHGLGVAPKVVIIKRRNGAGDWIVGHDGLASDAFANNKFLKLESNSSTFTNSVVWGSQPTSTVVQIVTGSGAGNLNGSSDTYVMYCFSEVAGYSKFGSYTGNGNADGTFVFTGFRPAYVLVKDISSSYSWDLHDNKRDPDNVTEKSLSPNLTNAEDTYDAKDFLANGFKLRSSSNSLNKSGDTYIYLAFAESPFKYARAR